MLPRPSSLLSNTNPMWVFLYTWWALQMSCREEVVNSRMVCPYRPICSLFVLEIRWRLRITDAKPSSYFYHKTLHKIRVLIPSAKVRCHENLDVSPSAVKAISEKVNSSLHLMKLMTLLTMKIQYVASFQLTLLFKPCIWLASKLVQQMFLFLNINSSYGK